MASPSLFFPRWQFPNNLGDSIMFTFVPDLFANIIGEPVDVVTDEQLGEILIKDSAVKSIKKPLLKDAESYRPIMPVWHPNVFKVFKQQYQTLVDHPTANIITLNYLLQLGLEDWIHKDFDLSPRIYGIPKPSNQTLTIGIAPATKLSGKPTPLPGS